MEFECGKGGVEQSKKRRHRHCRLHRPSQRSDVSDEIVNIGQMAIDGSRVDVY